jgi:hypothetical protein
MRYLLYYSRGLGDAICIVENNGADHPNVFGASIFRVHEPGWRNHLLAGSEKVLVVLRVLRAAARNISAGKPG